MNLEQFKQHLGALMQNASNFQTVIAKIEASPYEYSSSKIELFKFHVVLFGATNDPSQARQAGLSLIAELKEKLPFVPRPNRKLPVDDELNELQVQSEKLLRDSEVLLEATMAAHRAEEIKQLIVKGNVEAAIRKLLVIASKTYYKNVVINLSQQYQHLKRDSLSGTISREEFGRERNKITHSLLEIADEIGQ